MAAKTSLDANVAVDRVSSVDAFDSDYDPAKPFPTEEEWATLERVPGTIPWTAWTVAIVEFMERFSYYGTSAVFVNFIQNPLPKGSHTGAGFLKEHSGALDMGQRASTGLTTFNQFWSYFTPLLGAYLADTYWGRYLTIQYSNVVVIVGHIILLLSAVPAIITNTNAAIALFVIGLVVMGVGTGGFKSNIAPLIAEQYKDAKAYVRTNKKGVKEIVDPAATTARIYIYFYFLINVGSLTGSIAMVYSEHFVGFWLSYTLPTIAYLICPAILFYFKKRYTLSPPTGSVMGKSWKLWRFAYKKSKGFRDPLFWERVKPSEMRSRGETLPSWMTFDDLWVDEVKRGILACKVFLWYPVYYLAYNQITGNLISQSRTMVLGSTPNDIVAKLNPIFIIIVIPIMDFLIYPAVRKAGIRITPIRKIAAGFIVASMAMISACVIQAYIYKLSKCGDHINASIKAGRKDCTAPISVWVQVFPYGLIGMSEVLASITRLEYAYTKAPKNMRSTVQAIALFTSAISSALGQALTALSDDPLLVWNYGSVAVLAFIGGIGFWMTFRQADRDEDELNNQDSSAYLGTNAGNETEVKVVPTEKVAETKTVV